MIGMYLLCARLPFGFATGVLLFLLAGCGNRTLDGSSQESFKQSVAEVSRTLPEEERSGFMDDLVALAQSEGTWRLEEPTLATLVALDGKTPEMVRDRAIALRQAQRRERLSRQLEVARAELDKVTKRLEFAKESHQSIELFATQLDNLVATDVSSLPSLERPAEMVLRFTLENRNETPVGLIGIELTARSPTSGTSKTHKALSMLGLSHVCGLYGTTIAAGARVPVTCPTTLPFESETEYSVRVSEIRPSGPNAWVHGMMSAERAQSQANELSVEYADKLKVVQDLEVQLQRADAARQP